MKLSLLIVSAVLLASCSSCPPSDVRIEKDRINLPPVTGGAPPVYAR